MLSGRNGLIEFDVIVVSPLDAVEQHGVDIVSDLQNLLSRGLRVGIVGLGPQGKSSRYRNERLIKYCFDLGVPILGPKDVAKCQLAIIYNLDLFAVRVVRGKFRSRHLWLIVDGTEAASRNIDQLFSKCAIFCGSEPEFKAVSEAAQESLPAMAGPVQLWNFHALEPDESYVEASVVPTVRNNRIGVAVAGFTREEVAELKAMSERLALEGYVLCIRDSVPTSLQRGRGEADYLIGLPFVEAKAADFISSLRMYVLSLSALGAEGWKENTYLCMRLGVPVLLPAVLERYFGDAAYYYVSSPQERLASLDLESTEVRRTCERAKVLWGLRSRARANKQLGQVGVTGTPNAQAHRRAQNFAESSIRPSPQPSSGKVCFVTSNGAGMGHLTRLLAVARRLEDGVEATFLSMSQACGVVADYGFRFEYVPSKGDLQIRGDEWNTFFNKRFMESLQELNPDVVVFDGTWPYQGVARAVVGYDAKFVWMRRGMWRAETPDTSLVRNANFTSVVEPGDLAASYDAGPTSMALDALKVEPIIVLDPSEIFDRGEAREYLGLAPEEKCMLITLGAGNINKLDEDVAAVIEAVRELPDEWRVFMTSPAIADDVEVLVGVETMSIYPLARVAKAFDFVVSATGYNSFHEWIAYAVPALWIPNADTKTDDQVSRARYAHDSGLGIAAGPHGAMPVSEAIQLIAQDRVREEIETEMGRISFVNGAEVAARHISVLAKGDGLR